MKETLTNIVLPIAVFLMLLASVLLWMPFGMGYYGFPWREFEARIGIQVFALSFVVFSVMFLVQSISIGKLLGIGFGAFSVIVSLLSIFALYSWKDQHLDFLDQRDAEHNSESGSGEH